MHKPSHPGAPLLVVGLRAGFLMGVAALLVTGIVGGLLRAGVAVPVPGDSIWPGQAVLADVGPAAARGVSRTRRDHRPV